MILLGREHIRKYTKEPFGTIYLRRRLSFFLVYLCGSQDFVVTLPRTDAHAHGICPGKGTNEMAEHSHGL